MPVGIVRLPGPTLVVANRFVASPVGEFCELMVAEPARLGARPAWCVTTSVVNSADARVGGRLNWGLPRVLGAVAWWEDPDEVVVRWEDRGIVLRAPLDGLPLPFMVPMPRAPTPARRRGHRSDQVARMGRPDQGHVRGSRRGRSRPARRPPPGRSRPGPADEDPSRPPSCRPPGHPGCSPARSRAGRGGGGLDRLPAVRRAGG